MTSILPDIFIFRYPPQYLWVKVSQSWGVRGAGMNDHARTKAINRRGRRDPLRIRREKALLFFVIFVFLVVNSTVFQGSHFVTPRTPRPLYAVPSGMSKTA